MTDDSKKHSWPGWAEAITKQRKFGLELQSPFSKYVLNGRKPIETRAYALPLGLHQVKIDILESEKGQAGVSSIPDRVFLTDTSDDASTTHPPPLLRRRGWCTFTKSFRYTSREQFEADADKHLVDSSSGYGWSEERPMYGWIVGSCAFYPSDESISIEELVAERRMRSLFEITNKCQKENGSTILITGASGMLGRAIHRLLLESSSSSKYTIIGTGNTRLQVDHYPDYFSRPNNDTASKPKTVQLHQLNLLDFQSTTDFVQECRPDVIVHCAAERYPDAFETKLEESTKLNVESTKHLARECQRLATAAAAVNNKKDSASDKSRRKAGPYLIYISTSYVFDGGIISKIYPPYHPESKVNPLNNYGRSKWEGECAVRDILNKNPTANEEEGPTAGRRGIVVRVPLLYGEDCCALGESSALDIMKSFLQKTAKEARQSSRKKIDHWAPRFPTSVEDVARVLKLMIDQMLENKFPAVDSSLLSETNTYHIASPHKQTKYELMQLQSKLLNIPVRQVTERTVGDSSGPSEDSAPRPQCTQLDCSQTWKALGLNDADEQFEFVTLEDGMRRALKGFPERFMEK